MAAGSPAAAAAVSALTIEERETIENVRNLQSASALLAISSVAEAQWVMLARRAVGRVEQMSQQSPQAGGASYDSAAVMLDAPANKVYAAVLRGLQNAQGITITREVPRDGSSNSRTASRSPASR